MSDKQAAVCCILTLLVFGLLFSPELLGIVWAFAQIAFIWAILYFFYSGIRDAFR